MPQIQFAEQTYTDAASSVSSERLLNLYMERKPASAKSAVVLHGTPGLTLFAEAVGTGPIRGMIGMGDYLFVATGADLYRVDVFGAATLIGGLNGIRPVSMAQNGTQVCIVDDSDIFSATDTAITLLSESNCVGVAVQDGYGLFARRDSQEMFISAINDFTTFDPTEFTLVNALPDKNVGIVNVNRETWVFQEGSTQVYYNSGNADFPFARIPSGVIQRGALGSRSIVENMGSVFWLGDDKQVYKCAGGYVPQAISTAAVDRAIESYADPSAAVAFVYSQRGHTFYVLTFDEATWVYDDTTQRWHERQSDGLDHWRVHTFAFWKQRLLVGDSLSGNIYLLDLDAYTDNGDIIRRKAIAPPIFAEGKRITMHSLLVEFEVGVGLATGQGSDPQAMLRWSDDNGKTWSSEYWRSMGKIGEYDRRAKWTRLGQFRQRTLELTISDPVQVAILGAYVDIEVGAEAA